MSTKPRFQVGDVVEFDPSSGVNLNVLVSIAMIITDGAIRKTVCGSPSPLSTST